MFNHVPPGLNMGLLECLPRQACPPPPGWSCHAVKLSLGGWGGEGGCRALSPKSSTLAGGGVGGRNKKALWEAPETSESMPMPGEVPQARYGVCQAKNRGLTKCQPAHAPKLPAFFTKLVINGIFPPILYILDHGHDMKFTKNRIWGVEGEATVRGRCLSMGETHENSCITNA